MKPLIIANWKCNPVTLQEAKQLLNSVHRGLKSIKNVEVVICPPFLYIPMLGASSFARHKASYGGLAFGSQNCFWEERGPFTGEISPLMLKDLGCQYVILGHSERRRYLGETDEMINKKLRVALKFNLRPILCVGDKNRKSKGDIKEIGTQLKKDLRGLKKSGLSKLIITYEPIWAISTTRGGIEATPEDASEGALYIKKILYKLVGRIITQKIKILYGGSVDSKNINSFIHKGQVDGVLVGAASLNPKEFVQIVKRVS